MQSDIDDTMNSHRAMDARARKNLRELETDANLLSELHSSIDEEIAAFEGHIRRCDRVIAAGFRQNLREKLEPKLFGQMDNMNGSKILKQTPPREGQ